MPFSVEDTYIDEAERALHVSLPPPFRAYLMQTNGGEVVIDDEWWGVFPVFDRSSRQRITRTCNHLVRESELARSSDGFPPGAVAFAENGSGDYLVFLRHRDSSSALHETVYRWDHETRELVELTFRF